MIEVAQALIIKQGKYLAVKEKTDLEWKLPGGKKENTETLEQTLIRELKEEINITDFTIKGKLSPFIVPWKGKEYKFHVYHIHTRQQPQKTKDPDEIYFEWQELENMPKTSNMALQTLYSKLQEIPIK